MIGLLAVQYLARVQLTSMEMKWKISEHEKRRGRYCFGASHSYFRKPSEIQFSRRCRTLYGRKVEQRLDQTAIDLEKPLSRSADVLTLALQFEHTVLGARWLPPSARLMFQPRSRMLMPRPSNCRHYDC